jgi:hypothetical protein
MDLLMSHPKADRREDLNRILTSERSEDYVTWNVLRGIEQRDSGEWWPEMVTLARRRGASDAPPPDEPLKVALWRTVRSPVGYEKLSRRRMSESGNPEWMARALIPDPVEGPTEVDLVLEGGSYLVFVEAKLDSDLSWRTTYDPNRNQIVRNIDCVIEQAEDREAYFWMFVKDDGPGRGYVQFLERVAEDSSVVAALLPHRDPALVARIARRTATIRWSDLLTLLPTTTELRPVRAELERRIG